MPKFMDIHSGMTGLDQGKLEAAHKMDVDIQAQEGVKFLHSWADHAAGKVFCLSEGPDMDAVKRVHERAGHKADEIYEIDLEAE
jgi:hypothetical protein